MATLLPPPPRACTAAIVPGKHISVRVLPDCKPKDASIPREHGSDWFWRRSLRSAGAEARYPIEEVLRIWASFATARGMSKEVASPSAAPPQTDEVYDESWPRNT